MSEKNFELRKLRTKGLFPMMKILSKIGIGEFKKCFELDDIKKAVGREADLGAIGIGVLLDAADVLLKNIGSCEKEIYSFLADLSGLSVKDIQELDMAVFAEMIVELIMRDEFKDFFSAVSKLITKAK